MLDRSRQGQTVGGVEPLQPDAVQIRDQRRGLPVDVDTLANLAAFDALADQADDQIMQIGLPLQHIVTNRRLRCDPLGAHHDLQTG